MEREKRQTRMDLKPTTYPAGAYTIEPLGITRAKLATFKFQSGVTED